MSEKQRAFCGWSGGKDSCLALHRAKMSGCLPRTLFSLVEEGGDVSRSHGLTTEVLVAQAGCLGMELETIPCSPGGVGEAMEKALGGAVHKGWRIGIFGDIFVEEHREWIIELARRSGFRPLFPLWGCDTRELVGEFISLGYKAVVVSVRKGLLDAALLGRDVDEDFLSLLESKGIDPCGENGEYHTLVYDGPLFREPLNFAAGGIREKEKAYRMEISLA